MYGGAAARGQLTQCAAGPDILVATPGRLTDFLDRDLVDLSYTRFLVLDEADRMLDMGFEPQLRRIVSSNLPAAGRRQTLMFSATFADGVQKIASAYLKQDYVFVSVGRVGSTTASITQKIVRVEGAFDKRSKLEIILGQVRRRGREKGRENREEERNKACFCALLLVYFGRRYFPGCLPRENEAPN